MQCRVDPMKHTVQPGARRAGWSVQQLPEDIGACRTERFVNGRGLMLALTRYAPVHDIVEESHRPERRRTLTVTVALHGDSAYACADGAALVFRQGFTTVAASRATFGERYFRAHSAISQVRIAVDEAELAHYVGTERADALLGDRPLQQMAFHPTAAGALGHAHALLRMAGSAAPDPLALHIHMLGVLHEEAQRIAPEHLGSARHLSAAEAARVERAHGLMREWMGRPVSVAVLAAAVGSSTFKLRQGFHSMYGRSPQDMLQSIRMQHALALLESGMQVAAVAYKVGYGHPANFSAAFSRYYGKMPKSVPTRPPSAPDMPSRMGGC